MLRSVVTAKPSFSRISIHAEQQPQFGSFITWIAGFCSAHAANGAAAKLAEQASRLRRVRNMRSPFKGSSGRLGGRMGCRAAAEDGQPLGGGGAEIQQPQGVERDQNGRPGIRQDRDPKTGNAEHCGDKEHDL